MEGGTDGGERSVAIQLLRVLDLWVVTSWSGGDFWRQKWRHEELLTFATGVVILVSSLLFSVPSTYTIRSLIRPHA